MKYICNDNPKKTITILGSLTQDKELESIAKSIADKYNVSVYYQTKEPDKDINDLITSCYYAISVSDFIYAHRKHDGEYGTGVTYEIGYARYTNKKICYYLKSLYNLLDKNKLHK